MPQNGAHCHSVRRRKHRPRGATGSRNLCPRRTGPRSCTARPRLARGCPTVPSDNRDRVLAGTAGSEALKGIEAGSEKWARTRHKMTIAPEQGNTFMLNEHEQNGMHGKERPPTPDKAPPKRTKQSHSAPCQQAGRSAHLCLTLPRLTPPPPDPDQNPTHHQFPEHVMSSPHASLPAPRPTHCLSHSSRRPDR